MLFLVTNAVSPLQLLSRDMYLGLPVPISVYVLSTPGITLLPLGGSYFRSK